MRNDPKQMGRKSFMAFFCSICHVKEHTKSRHNLDNQKGVTSELKKPALTTCLSVGFNSIKPVYMLNLFILLNIITIFKCVMLPEVSCDIGDGLSIT